MKLTDFPPDRLAVQDGKVPIYVESTEPLPSTVSLQLDVHYEEVGGQPARKTLTREVTCERIMPESATDTAWRFRLIWMVDLELAGLGEHLAQVSFRLTHMGVRAISPDTITVVGIEITRQHQLKRIMLHEFSLPDGSFDSLSVSNYLNGLTAQQRIVLLRTASQKQNAQGRLVIFISLYPKPERRMYADWSDNTDGVIPNATFSVFFCRNDVKLKVDAPSTSPITLVCHTEYFCVCLKNKPTKAWLNPPQGDPRAPGVYSGKRPNQWLDKANLRPPQFKIAALQPSAKVSYAVIWSAIYEAGSGKNIMPGNSVHGMINTRGCWMLFRNFNWPKAVAKKLDPIYRKVYRPAELALWRVNPDAQLKTPPAALIAKLKEVGYYKDVSPEEEKRESSTFDKFRKFDRNWAYEWFFRDVVGISYFSDTDYWGNPDSVNDYEVGGHKLVTNFPLNKKWRQDNLAYHDFKHRSPHVKIGPNLFTENALGVKTASDFSKDMHGELTQEQLGSLCWADVYFYKEESVKDVEKLSEEHVTDKS